MMYFATYAFLYYFGHKNHRQNITFYFQHTCIHRSSFLVYFFPFISRTADQFLISNFNTSRILIFVYSGHTYSFICCPLHCKFFVILHFKDKNLHTVSYCVENYICFLLGASLRKISGRFVVL